tara:strand:- start:16284 stop:16535 length:252 start_codon:yes stop_codon:yes gene_type:complete
LITDGAERRGKAGNPNAVKHFLVAIFDSKVVIRISAATIHALASVATKLKWRNLPLLNVSTRCGKPNKTCYVEQARKKISSEL